MQLTVNNPSADRGVHPEDFNKNFWFNDGCEIRIIILPNHHHWLLIVGTFAYRPLASKRRRKSRSFSLNPRESARKQLYKILFSLGVLNRGVGVKFCVYVRKNILVRLPFLKVFKMLKHPCMINE